MVQTKIEHFPVCEHFDYCKSLMLSPGFGLSNKEQYKDIADTKGLPCYENDQSGCSKFNYLEANGEKIQVRGIPASMRKRLKKQIEQPVRTPKELTYIA